MKTRATIALPEGILDKNDIHKDIIYIKDEEMHEYKLVVKGRDGTWQHGQHISIGQLVYLLETTMGKFSWEEILTALVGLCKIENFDLIKYIEDVKKIDRMLETLHQRVAYMKIQDKENLAKIGEQRSEIEYYTGQISWYEQILGQMGAGQLLGERPGDSDDWFDEDDEGEEYEDGDYDD